MKQFTYNKTTDDFTVTVDPEELETMRLWLKEARNGVELRIRHGYFPVDAESKLMALEATLSQMEELKNWREKGNAK